MANVFEKEISFNIACDTVDGAKTNPRIDEPGFSVGLLDFELNVREQVNFGPEFFAVCMDLSKTSKKTMMPGYEIIVKEVRVDYTFNAGASSGTTIRGPMSIQDDPIFHFAIMEHCDVKLVMEFIDVQRYPVHFLDAEAAKKKRYDCKVVIVDDENEEVFVHKNILAFNSSFFDTLFYGDCEEKDQKVVKLSNVMLTDFLEYLCCVYPPPNQQFAFKKLDVLLRLANRFQNKSLMASIEKFLMEEKDESSTKKQQVLLWADAFNMDSLFSVTLKTMSEEELKILDMTACKKFKKDNLELLMAYILALIHQNTSESTNAESTDMDFYETSISFNIFYETINGVKTPRIDKPDFTVGGLEFQLSTRNIVDEEKCTVFMQLSEASKKKLVTGYEIELTSFESRTLEEDGSTLTFSASDTYTLSEDPVEVYSYPTKYRRIYVTMTMAFCDVFPHRLQFVDAEEAKKNFSDCKIVLTDDKNKEVFVHKHILAFRSPFFQTLFFGDFKERDQDVVTLSNVTEEDFIDYLFCVYPQPIRPFDVMRLDDILCLADRFQNDFLTASIKKFLEEKKDRTPWEKRETLILANAYGFPELFRVTLQTMDKTELKELNLEECKNFKEDNVELLLSYFIAQL